jgi:transposase
MSIELSNEEKSALERHHRTERDGKIRDRIKAVLLYSEGWTQEQIAQALRIHDTTVHEHLKRYREEKALTINSGGSVSKLSEEKSQKLEKHLEANTYSTIKEIVAYVKERYKVDYTEQGMHAWLLRHHFTYKKPKGVPLKVNIQKQEAFIEEYEEIKKSLKADEMILFMDSVHPTQATKLSYGWIKKGVEKMIATVAGRQRINLTGAIELNTLSMVTEQYETINGEATVDFLNKVLEAYPNAQTIHIIADGGRAHTSEEVKLFLSESKAVNKAYLKDQYGIELPSNTTRLTKKMKKELRVVLKKEPSLFTQKSILEVEHLTSFELLKTMKKHSPHPKIVLHILPPYSPNLNPIERVWKIANEEVRNNVVFSSFKDFKEKMTDFFERQWGTMLDQFKDRVNDNFQTLNPAF